MDCSIRNARRSTALSRPDNGRRGRHRFELPPTGRFGLQFPIWVKAIVATADPMPQLASVVNRVPVSPQPIPSGRRASSVPACSRTAIARSCRSIRRNRWPGRAPRQQALDAAFCSPDSFAFKAARGRDAASPKSRALSRPPRPRKPAASSGDQRCTFRPTAGRRAAPEECHRVLRRIGQRPDRAYAGRVVPGQVPRPQPIQSDSRFAIRAGASDPYECRTIAVPVTADPVGVRASCWRMSFHTIRLSRCATDG